jgi:L,D-peptidoglycan transpeptidase YkuD (ErfK/YbiS/YcfS/YnhG family)
VVARSSDATTATVTAWTRAATGWFIAIGPVTAYIGTSGLGQAREGSSVTPAGTYALTRAYGRQPNPGTALPYRQVDSMDWWDENPQSPTYNTYVRQSASPGGESENLYGAGYPYDYLVNIDYNTAHVPYAGSAFFIHVTFGAPTQGCVALERSTMVALLNWLNPEQSPVVILGVG